MNNKSRGWLDHYGLSTWVIWVQNWTSVLFLDSSTGRKYL